MFKFLTEGLITSFTMVHHWIADQLPTLGCSLEEIVEIEDGKRVSSRQWTLCLNSSKIPPYEIDEPRKVPF